LRIVEAPFLVCSGRDAESFHPEYSAAQSADRFNCVAERCAERGIAFYYHCFDWVFRSSAGVNFLNELLSRTNEELVRYNIDLMWTKAAGQDPVKVIETIGCRCDYYHFKDGAGLSEAAAPQFLPLGSGEVGIKQCLAAIVSLGNPYHLVVELSWFSVKWKARRLELAG
jgi:sugar phosphate isomerase/epimerase